MSDKKHTPCCIFPESQMRWNIFSERNLMMIYMYISIGIYIYFLLNTPFDLQHITEIKLNTDQQKCSVFLLCLSVQFLVRPPDGTKCIEKHEKCTFYFNSSAYNCNTLHEVKMGVSDQWALPKLTDASWPCWHRGFWLLWQQLKWLRLLVVLREGLWSISRWSVIFIFNFVTAVAITTHCYQSCYS